MVKNLPGNAGDARDVGPIPGSGRSPGEGDGCPLQYSCLGNPSERGGLWDLPVSYKVSSSFKIELSLTHICICIYAAVV